MSGNNAEGREQSIINSNTVDEEFLLSFVNGLIEDESTIDGNAMIKEITNLQERSLLDLVNSLSQLAPIPITNPSNNKVVTELILLRVKLGEISQRLTAIGEKLQELGNK